MDAERNFIQIKELDNLIDTILTNKEVKDYYMAVLATGLCGITLQKFHICTGTGGNGKSILNSLALDCSGKYGYKLNKTFDDNNYMNVSITMNLSKQIKERDLKIK